jgi:hypothetical protein
MEFKPKIENFDGSFDVREATRKEVMKLTALVRCLYRGGEYDDEVLVKVQELVEQISGLGGDDVFLALPVIQQSFLLEHLAHVYIGGIPGN